jgi:RNA polymerase sigma-70 factor (ECF subfamily)
MFLNLSAATLGIALMLAVPGLAHAESVPEDAALGRSQISTLLEAAVAGLPTELRLVFLLHEVEGLGLLAIARTLLLNPITVRTRLYRARMRLRAELEARLMGGFESIFPFDGARCTRVADRVIANLIRMKFFAK